MANSSPNTKSQKSGRSTVAQVMSQSETTRVIHYSCESFYDRRDGSSPRITSIAIRRPHNGQTYSFSIHQIAERTGRNLSQIKEHYDDLEKEMLTEFFEYLRLNSEAKYIHWNMRDINYGFQAIEHRFKVLGGDPYILDDKYKIDLARILIDIYGVGYTGHPRLVTLLEKNKIRPRDFLTGQQEADAFENEKFVDLHQSTLRKVDVMENILTRINNRNLKTNTSWWGMNGGNIRRIVNLVITHPFLTFLGLIATFLGLFFAMMSF